MPLLHNGPHPVKAAISQWREISHGVIADVLTAHIGHGAVHVNIDPQSGVVDVATPDVDRFFADLAVRDH
jgi:hypothetical protein